jgi:hypothetical protein
MFPIVSVIARLPRGLESGLQRAHFRGHRRRGGHGRIILIVRVQLESPFRAAKLASMLHPIVQFRRVD